MARPKKIVEETTETKIEETIENETNSHKMSVVYDTVAKEIVLVPVNELSPRYKPV